MPTLSLQPRDRAILEHVARYRLTTLPVLHRLFFPERTDEAAKSVVKRLTPEFLGAQPLYGRRVFYQLTTTGARLLGEAEEAARPLGAVARPTRLAVLDYCCLAHQPERRRFTRREFAEAFPDLAEVPFTDFTLDDAGPRLTRLHVDLGGDYRRFLRKLREYLARDLACPPFARLVRERCFALAVLTAEEAKRDAFLEALRRTPLSAPTSVEVVPDLAQFPREAP